MRKWEAGAIELRAQSSYVWHNELNLLGKEEYVFWNDILSVFSLQCFCVSTVTKSIIIYDYVTMLSQYIFKPIVFSVSVHK